MKCRTGVIQERRDSGNKGCMKEGIQELRDAKFGFEKLRSGTIFSFAAANPPFVPRNCHCAIYVYLSIFAPPRHAPSFLVCASGVVALKLAKVPNTAINN